MAKRALSSQFVTVYVSLIFSFSAQAATLTVGYQTQINTAETFMVRNGTAKAIGETAKFLKEQGKVETVLPDYSPYVSAKFVQE